jgi:hypothetical protein
MPVTTIVGDEVQQGPPRATRPEFSFRTRLEAELYQLRFAYNSRMQRWFMDVQAPDGTDIVRGIRVATGHNLIRPFQADPRLPRGQLFVVDDSGADRDPDRFGWRGDFRLVYRPIAIVTGAAGTDNEVD